MRSARAVRIFAEKMYRFLHFPFETPNLVSFSSNLDSDQRIAVLSQLKLLAGAIGDDGLKATATGNLPRSFCRESAKTFLGEKAYQRWSCCGELRSKPEFRVRKLPLLDQVVQFNF